jgi:GNAT superfamily N-acetyltransferase
MELAHGRHFDKEFCQWKYRLNPMSADIKVFVAEHNGEIVGSTTRLPFDLIINRGSFRIYFNVDSFVHPQFQRKGIITLLYEHTRKIMPVMFSKGATMNMNAAIMKMGYRVLSPNAFQIKYLAPFQLLLKKFNLYSQESTPPKYEESFSPGYHPVEEFGDEFDKFWERVAHLYPGIIKKKSAYMNWRYLDIPHKTYHVFYRKIDERIITVLVFKIEKTHASIVDIIWDPTFKDEPEYSIGKLIEYAKKCRLMKITCWSTFHKLRHSLRQKGFIVRGYTQNFSLCSSPDTANNFSNVGNIHIVDGDSDSEYSR